MRLNMPKNQPLR
ncbi:serine hydroxymethyltransferase [Crocosphaera chwakensis CCY0110]|uniref:Serine hydroxymethyltransferase n=1 Tax=Crocosphaera chwakensis CCY0110 TaxID=391612 RepID=A3IIT9_9CHRO|nr:serine hydroxymethyltransferase [Crocosphaera chwakensis CCY0110]